MKRSQAVMETAQRLFAAERAIDSAFAQTADFAAGLAKTRMETGLSATVGQSAFEEVTAALAGLAQVRGSMVRAHEQLNATKARIGCRTVATGGGDKEETDYIAPAAALKVVTAA